MFPDGSQIVCYLLATNQGYCINAIPASGSNAKRELKWFT